MVTSLTQDSQPPTTENQSVYYISSDQTGGLSPITWDEADGAAASEVSLDSLYQPESLVLPDEGVRDLNASPEDHVSVTSFHPPGFTPQLDQYPQPLQHHNEEPVHESTTSAVNTPHIAGPDEESDEQHSGSSGRVKPKRREIAVAWWWWWEIGGAIVCIGSFLSILIMLCIWQDKPLDAWPYTIRPNSLLSVSTTIGKAALMVPITSCISQLKWHHFMGRGHRLSDIQIIDDASRGPWGSAVALMSLRSRAIMIWLLAILTISALGIEPTAQQVLNFPQRSATLLNVTALLGTATNYSSEGFINDDASSLAWPQRPQALAMESSILVGATGSVSTPSMTCPSPASNCTWPEFTSLALCGSVRNVTDITKRTCDFADVILNCNYTFPGAVGTVSMSFMNMEIPHAGVDDQASSTVLGSYGFGWLGQDIRVLVVRVQDPDNVDHSRSPSEPPRTESLALEWHWCAQTHHDTFAAPDGKIHSRVTSEGLTQRNASEIDLRKDQLPYYSYISLSTGISYNTTEAATNSLFGFLGSLFSVEVHKIGRSDRLFDIGSMMLRTNLTTFVQNVADTITGQIQSVDSGENSFATTVEGVGFAQETYIEVRWPWLALPLACALFSCVFLVISIYMVRRQPLLKTSAVAFLFHRLEGWTDEELGLTGSENAAELERLATRMSAQLRDDYDGRLRFIKC